jgi:hypothetical protein
VAPATLGWEVPRLWIEAAPIADQLIVDASCEIEYLAEKMLGPWLDLVAAAAKDGIEVAINDAFRTYGDQ